jgi:hypothetical protein
MKQTDTRIQLIEPKKKQKDVLYYHHDIPTSDDKTLE